MADKKKMEPWVSEDILDLEGLEKEDIWDMMMQEFPRMEQSPIFEAGYENWEPYNEENLKKHKEYARKYIIPGMKKYSGQTLDASAIDFLNTINVERHVDRENLGSLVGHEIPHLGMRLDSEWNQLFPPWAWSGIEGRIEKEEKLNMMHDAMYQYTPRGTYGYYAKGHKDNLMNRGYIERIPGGPGYAGGHQYTGKGNELIRTSGLPERMQQGLGYYESPNRSQEQERQERQSTINWLNSRIGGSPQRSGNRPTMADVAGPVSGRRPNPHQDFNGGGIASLGGQWSPSVIEGDEEIYDIKPLQMDPGIMSIDDLEDLFEEVGLDKRLIYNLINTGGLSQLVS